MFDRVQYEPWHVIFPVAGFLLLFIIFILLVIRISRLPKGKVKHLAHLPFDEEDKDKHDESTGPEKR